jgi:hypothetical protein
MELLPLLPRELVVCEILGRFADRGTVYGFALVNKEWHKLAMPILNAHLCEGLTVNPAAGEWVGRYSAGRGHRTWDERFFLTEDLGGEIHDFRNLVDMPPGAANLFRYPHPSWKVGVHLHEDADGDDPAGLGCTIDEVLDLTFFYRLDNGSGRHQWEPRHFGDADADASPTRTRRFLELAANVYKGRVLEYAPDNMGMYPLVLIDDWAALTDELRRAKVLLDKTLY